MEIKTERIIAYLENILPVNELNEFECQLANSEDFRKEVDEIACIRRMSIELKLHDKADTERNWSRLSKRIKADKYKAKLLRFSHSAAAILLLPVLLLTTFLYLELNSKKNEPVQQVQVVSAYGTVSKTTLPDGTEVWLNSGSTLTHPQFFTQNKRSVYLTGEAYFKVSSDKSNPFDVIVSDELVVSAYGTEFNINSYHEDKTIDVTLVEGNIEIARAADKAASENILPGQHLTYNKKNKSIAMTDVNTSVNTGWKDGKMIFRRTNMTEVAQRLSRHFNVDIRLEGKELYDYEYSATFTTETLSEILQLLERTAPIKYTIIEPKQSGDYSFTKKNVIISIKK